MNVTHEGNVVRAEHPAAVLCWDLARGGVLVYLHNRRSDVTLIDARGGGPGPDLVFSVSAALEDEPHDLSLSAMGTAEAEILCTSDGSRIKVRLTARGQELKVVREISLDADSDWIEERLFLENTDERDLLIDRHPAWDQAGGAVAGDLYDHRIEPGGVDYRLAGLRLGENWAEDEYVMPACGYPFFYNRGRFAEMGEVTINMVAGHHGAVFPGVMAYHDQKQSGLLYACLSERSMRYIHVAGDEPTQTGTLAMRIWWARWLSPGERQEVATFYLVPFAGEYGRMLDRFRHWLADEHGIHGPTRQSSRIDEMFVGILPNPLSSVLGDFRLLKPYLDVMKEIGCTVYWQNDNWLDAADVVEGALLSRCMPILRHGRYDTTDRFGGEEAHRDLRDYVHAQGMMYMIWITGSGSTTFTSLYKEHREAFITLRRPIENAMDSHPQWPGFDFSLGWEDDWVYHPFGGPTVGPDHTHPRWREFWLKNQEYWIANGVDGIFFDSFNPMPPNYALRPWPGQISLELNNLQRDARRRNQEINPDFFSMTEGGGYLLATVNDFTHTWHGCTPPPLPPYRTRPLTPEEEALFLRDEGLTMIVGARSWRTLVDSSHMCLQWDLEVTRPRILYSMFTPTMPVLPIFSRTADEREFETQTAYWEEFKPAPADAPDPRDKKQWDYIGSLWRIRQENPELKSGTLDLWAVQAEDAAVNAVLRLKDRAASILAINFRSESVPCKLTVDLHAAGISKEDQLAPRDLLRDAPLGNCTGADLECGYEVSIPSRDAVLIQLRSR